MRYKQMSKVTALMMTLVLLFGLTCCLSSFAYTADQATSIAGKLYRFDEKDHYEFESGKTGSITTVNNTYGTFYISGATASDGDDNKTASYSVNEGNVSFFYKYSDILRDAPENKWHLIEDSGKTVGDIKLNSSIKKGAIIVQSSKDGKRWITDIELTNAFAESQKTPKPLYTTKSVQLANGCFYRVIVVYETRIKLSEDNILFVKTNKYDYKKSAEVYTFYLHDAKQSTKDLNAPTKALGKLVRTEKENNGYAGGSPAIDIKDPHYGWELGSFFVSGYTRDTKDDSGNPVFLKTLGDKITLWFHLKQDIDKLHNDDALSIADDNKGYDQYFQTERTDMGRGTLIIQYTDPKGIKHDPEIYTNYLEANTTTSADTVVRLFEEGDYEVALDYKIKKAPRKIIGVDVIPAYSDYRISFKFSVRNGNCMVYPFDVKTGQELSDESITPNGFKLDMAKSRYLTIDVKYARVTPGANGYVEDVRFNRPAKDGDSYTEEGIYTFNVKNLYTKENTVKRIYVGDVDYLKALSLNNISVTELNDRVAAGAIIESSGAIVSPTPTPDSVGNSTPKPVVTPTPTAVSKPVNADPANIHAPENVAKNSSGSMIPIVVVIGIVISGAIFFVISKNKKNDSGN